MTELTQKHKPIKHVEAYGVLEAEDLGSEQPQGPGARKTWLASFMTEHLPTNRLRSKEDDLSSKYESLTCRRQPKRKKQRSKAPIKGPSWNRAERRRHRDLVPSLDSQYEIYLPLMQMWKKYMEELIQFSSLSDSGLINVAHKVMKSDLHGCPLVVKSSKCPSYIGVQGIVLQETKNTFVLVTPDNTIKRIPKANSIFCTVLHDIVFTIYGNQFLVKPGERTAKKFKAKPSIDL